MASPSDDGVVSTDPASVDLWVGTNLGVLKGVSLAKGGVVNYYSANKTLEDAHKSECVCALCWEHDHREGLLFCGLKSGVVQQFDVQQGTFQAECDCTGGPGQGTFVGLGKHEDVLVTCTDRGDLSFWPASSDKVSVYVGKDVSCMTPSPSTMMQVATGGRENELKLWDGSRPEMPIFQAKNVRSDKLDLRVPVWVTGIGYTADSGEHPTLAVATGYHQVRLYDTRAQRRPVYSQEYGEHPFNALTMTDDGKCFVVGNSIGEILRVDVRTGKVVGRYKGCRGGVKGLVTYMDEDQSRLAAVSLDRFLRVYSTENPKLLHKVYLKLQPTCVLVNSYSKELQEDREEEEPDKVVTSSGCQEEAVKEAGRSDDEDDVWGEMDVVADRPLKRKLKTRKSQKVIKKKKLKQAVH